MNDTIYRRDAIQALVDTEEIKGFAYRMLEDRLIGLPSADRPSKEGEWEIEEFTSIYGKGYRLTCSECGDVVTVTDEALPRERYYRYCGAKNTKRWKGAEDEH